MSAREELIAYRKMLRIARKALQRIRDYEVGAHSIAADALYAIEQEGFPYVGAKVDEDAPW